MANEPSKSRAATRRHIHLDGRTLEGGGQLVRIAIGLSILTGQPITIDHIRGNRAGKKGLKNSHLGAIKSLVDMSGSLVKGAQVNSSTLEFVPPEKTALLEGGPLIKPEIDIRLPTAGSVFLVFQALYPFLLLCTKPPSSTDLIRLCITGGTNASFAPSYDFVSQVLIPNFARLGLPHLSLHLKSRGWAIGPQSLGKVTFCLETLPRDCSENRQGENSKCPFPSINLNEFSRGEIFRIDITILGPDSPLQEIISGRGQADKGRSKKEYRKSCSVKHHDVHQMYADDEYLKLDYPENSPRTIRQFMEGELRRSLRKKIKKLPSFIFGSPEYLVRGQEDELRHDDEPIVPIYTHTSETTHHRSHLYMLIVAHTSTGFKISHDALYGAQRNKPGRGTGNMVDDVRSLVEECVDGFIDELYDATLQKQVPEKRGHPPCVDRHMRDQLVVFQALGRASGHEPKLGVDVEDERYWSLHTKTAQWVCQQMMGNVLYDGWS